MNTKLELLERLNLPDSDRPAPDFPDHWLTLCRDQSIIELTGPDARRFLQGQVTCDVENLPERLSVPGAACTPKGRAYVNFRLLADGNRLLVRMPSGLVERTLEVWRKYLAFFKADARELDGWCAIGLGGSLPDHLVWEGDQALPYLDGLLLPVPAMPGGHERHELWLPIRSIDRLDLADFQRLCPEAWQLSEIRAGILNLRPELAEQYVPQTFNWQALDGISFSKGCYTGQEIIARMRYLGQLKRSLHRVAMDHPAEEALPCRIDLNDQIVGELVDQAALADGSAEGLAVLRHGPATEPGLQCGPGNNVRILELPYEVPEQKVTN